MHKGSISEQEFLKKLSEVVEANLHNEGFGVNELATELRISRITLHRKVKTLLKKSVSEYIREYKLKRAYTFLKEKRGTASEISYEVGFHNPSYFNKCFHEYYGFTPGAVLNGLVADIERDEQNGFTTRRKISRRKILIVTMAFLLFFAIIVGVVKPFKFQQKELEKTIAVLPFRNNSPDSTNAYINGLMESILNNLQIIEELDVKSRTSVEQYRNTTLPLSQIAKELKVNYIVEGSAAKYGDEIVLNIQLLDANSDHHLLGETYQRQIKEVKDYIDIQAEIATDIASKIKARITETEKEEIKRLPTENLAAYRHYERGNEYLKLMYSNQATYNHDESKRNQKKAKAEFEKAIALDSSFARPLLYLSNIYISNLGNSPNFELQSAYLDSGLFLAEKVLSLNDVVKGSYAWALNLKGTYYQTKGMRDEAMKYFKQSEKIKSNDFLKWHYYQSLAVRHFIFEEYTESIENALKCINHLPEEEKTPIYILQQLDMSFTNTGHFEQAKKFAEKEFFSNNDSISYLINLAKIEWSSENNQKALEYLGSAYKIDSTNTGCLYWYTGVYAWQKEYSTALSYLEKYILAKEMSGSEITPNSFHGFIFLQNGRHKKADSIFSVAIKHHEKEIEYGVQNANKFYSHGNLAGIYSVKNEKEKALEYLNDFNQRKTISIMWLKIFQENPMFDNIRNEPKFQEILADSEKKYQKEHKRVGKFLREFGEID